MFFRLMFLFITVPFVELAVLIEIGRQIGTLDTLALIVLTGIAGAYLVKHQGILTFAQIQNHLQQGVFPADDLLDGLFILIAGAVLITPGVLTDIFGFCLLIPSIRRHIKKFFKTWLKKRLEKGQYQFSFWANS